MEYLSELFMIGIKFLNFELYICNSGNYYEFSLYLTNILLR